MADRWNEEQARAWREEERRHGRSAGPGAPGRGQDVFDEEGRSFSPRHEYDRDRGAWRQDPPNLTGPRYGAGGYTGYGDRQFGERGYGERNYSTGDDGRWPAHREDHGRADFEARRYDQAFQGPREAHSEFGFGFDLDGADGRYRREAAHVPGAEGGFWGRRGRQMFGLGDGPHRGRGPQGYKRSDERINEDVHERLTEDPHIDASAIVVAVSGGEVTLSGLVVSREAKHHAEHLVEHLSGVTHVQNNLRLDADAHRGTTHGPSFAPPLGENTKLSDQAAAKA